LESNFAWPKFNKVHDGNNLYLGDEKNMVHSHEYFDIMPYPSSTWEDGMSVANILHKMSFIDSPIFVINEESSCHNQVSEKFNQSNDVNVHYPNINDLAYLKKDHNLYTLFHLKDLSQFDYLKFKFRETHQEHETLQLQLMVMLGSRFLAPFSETNHIKNFSHDIIHDYFAHDPPSSLNFFQYFHFSHCIYHDRIEVRLEKCRWKAICMEKIWQH
jgi:hypothetical protein